MITLVVIRLHINEHLYTILFPVNERHKQPKKEKAWREMNAGATPCLFKQVSNSNTLLLCLVQSHKFLLTEKYKFDAHKEKHSSCVIIKDCRQLVMLFSRMSLEHIREVP